MTIRGEYLNGTSDGSTNLWFHPIDGDWTFDYSIEPPNIGDWQYGTPYLTSVSFHEIRFQCPHYVPGRYYVLVTTGDSEGDVSNVI
jgi:hypothetical protein